LVIGIKKEREKKNFFFFFFHFSHSLASRNHSVSRLGKMATRKSAPIGSGKGDPEQSALALYAYEGKYSDELTFNEGDVLTIISLTSIEEGWHKARTAEGRVGIVPGNYLKIVEGAGSLSRPSSLSDQNQNQNQNTSGDAGVTALASDSRDAPLLDGSFASSSHNNAAYGRQRQRVYSSWMQSCCGWCPWMKK
jgi:Variant SH3 domain